MFQWIGQAFNLSKANIFWLLFSNSNPKQHIAHKPEHVEHRLARLVLPKLQSCGKRTRKVGHAETYLCK